MAISIDPENKGKLTATIKRSGKSLSELAQSKNPLTRKRAQFAINAKKWGHSKEKNMSAIKQHLIEFAKLDLGYTYGNLGGMSVAPNEKKHYPSIYINDQKKPVDLPQSGKAIVEYVVRGRSMNQGEDGVEKHSATLDIKSIDPVEKDEKKKDGVKQLSAVKQDIIEFGLKDGPVGNFTRGIGKLIGLNRPTSQWKGALDSTLERMKQKRIKLPSEYSVNAGNAASKIFTKFSRIQQHLIEFADPRHRNALGEFSGGRGGNEVNPHAMAVAYQHPKLPGMIASGVAGGVASAGASELIRALAAKKLKRRR